MYAVLSAASEGLVRRVHDLEELALKPQPHFSATLPTSRYNSVPKQFLKVADLYLPYNAVAAVRNERGRSSSINVVGICASFLLYFLLHSREDRVHMAKGICI
jgi:hypothetical protein